MLQNFQSAILYTQPKLCVKDDIIAVCGEQGALWFAVIVQNYVTEFKLMIQWFWQLKNENKSKFKSDLYELCDVSYLDTLDYVFFICAEIYMKILHIYIHINTIVITVHSK